MLLRKSNRLYTWRRQIHAFTLIQTMVAASIAAGLGVAAMVSMRKFFIVNRLEYFVRQSGTQQEEAQRRIEMDLKDALPINGKSGNLHFNVARQGPTNSFDSSEIYDNFVIYKSLYPDLRGRAEVTNTSSTANGQTFDLHYVLDPQNAALNSYFSAALQNEDYFFVVSDRYRNIVKIDRTQSNVTASGTNCPQALQTTHQCFKTKVSFPTVTGYTGKYFETAGTETTAGSTSIIVGRKIIYRVDATSKSLLREEVDAQGGMISSEAILKNVGKMEVLYTFRPTDLREVNGGTQANVKIPSTPIRHPRDAATYWNSGVLGATQTDWPGKAVTFSDVQSLMIKFAVALPSDFANTNFGSESSFTIVNLPSGGRGVVANSNLRFLYPGNRNDAQINTGQALDPSCLYLETARCNPACAAKFTSDDPQNKWWKGYAVTQDQVQNWWHPTRGPSDICRCGKPYDSTQQKVVGNFVDPIKEGREKLPYWSVAVAWTQTAGWVGDESQFTKFWAGTDRDNSTFDPSVGFAGLSDQRKRLDYCAKVTDCAAGNAYFKTWVDAKHPLCGLARRCMLSGDEGSRQGGKWDFVNRNPNLPGYFNYEALADFAQNGDPNRQKLSCEFFNPNWYFDCDFTWDFFLNKSWDTVSNYPGKAPTNSVSLAGQTKIWRNSCACDINAPIPGTSNYYQKMPGGINWDAVCGLPNKERYGGVTATCTQNRDAGTGAWIMSDGTETTEAQKRERFRSRNYVNLCACFNNTSDSAFASGNSSGADFVASGPNRTGTNQVFAPTSSDIFWASGTWYLWNWQTRMDALGTDMRLDRLRANGVTDASNLTSSANFNLANEEWIPPGQTLSRPLKALPLPTTNANARLSSRMCGVGIASGKWDPKCNSNLSQKVTNIKWKTSSGAVQTDTSLVNCSTEQIRAAQGYLATPGHCMADAYNAYVSGNDFFTEPVPPNWPSLLKPTCNGVENAVSKTCDPMRDAQGNIVVQNGVSMDGSITLLVNLSSLDASLPNTTVDLWPYRFFCHSNCGTQPNDDWPNPINNQRNYIRYLWKKLFMQKSGQNFDPWTTYVGWCSFNNQANQSGTSLGGN